MTVDISSTVHARLSTSTASRCIAWAVAIIQTFNTLVLSEGTSRSSSSRRTVSISFTDTTRVTYRKNTHGIARALSVLLLGTSPLGNRAVSIRGTLNTATSLNIAARSTGILTLVISSTEVHAKGGDRVTVGVDVAGSRGTIKVLASCSSSEESAGLAASILITVSCGTVTVGGTVNAGSRCDITHRLVGFETSIVNAVSVRSAGLARLISHTVVTLSIRLATIVIPRSRRGITFEGVNTKTVISADCVNG